MENLTPKPFLPRAASDAIERAASVAPVVVLLGARQTGKTTLLRSMPLFKDHEYLNMDDFDLRMQAEAEPEAVVGRALNLILDEVQRARDLLVAVKRAVDADPHRTPGRFTITGSANLLMMEQISETLAGRAVYVTLLPFTRRERFGLMRAACLRIGNLVNQTEMGRDVGISQPQVHRFFKVMETGFQAVRLAAYAVNRTRRLIKAPKIYWSDTGLALFLAGEDTPRGAHLENMILTDLLAWRDLQAHRPEVLYWRTVTGLEVDFVVETSKRLLPVEIKASPRVTMADAKGLEAFLDEYPDMTDGALLIYDGKEVFPLTRRVLAAPWWKVI